MTSLWQFLKWYPAAILLTLGNYLLLPVLAYQHFKAEGVASAVAVVVVTVITNTMFLLLLLSPLIFGAALLRPSLSN